MNIEKMFTAVITSKDTRIEMKKSNAVGAWSVKSLIGGDERIYIDFEEGYGVSYSADDYEVFLTDPILVLRDEGRVDAVSIIKEYGFVDKTPEIGNAAQKIFEKDGKQYVFIGWHHLNPTKRLWEDIVLKPIEKTCGKPLI